VTKERWARVKELFHAAIERPPDARDAFLMAAAADDESIRRDVESLLAMDADEASVLAGFSFAPETGVVDSLMRGALVQHAPPRPPLAAGHRIGLYEIVELLGAGAMGEVYRTRDTRLNREVALKVMPALLAMDVDRLARFRREAMLLAALNHPNIAAIYGVEDAGDVPALVLELIDGPTLAARIRQAPLPLAEAVGIGRQIAEGIEAAHAQGIIHRDLKPSNIQVRADGLVKILDFGLAKSLAVEPALQTAEDGSAAPASEPRGTREGMILGTAAYMSPEQARGQAVDKRGDIWAFGCVLFEMLTGQPAFRGETVTDLLAAVVKDDPDWSALPHDLPSGVRTLLRRCLNKDPRHRLQAIGDARIELDEIGAGDDRNDHATRTAATERVVWLVAVVVLGIAAAGALLVAVRPAVAVPEMRLDIATPATTDPASMALSPDGQKLVFSATNADGRAQLWIRWLSDVVPRALPSTEAGRYPFWSPDSRSIGFFANGRLKRVDAEGGSLREIADAPLGLGGTWNRDGVIVFAANWVGPLLRVSAAGGSPVETTQLTPGQTGHRFPQFLPDGRHFLFESIEGGGISGVVYVGNLDAGAAERLIDSGASATYAPSGHIVFARGAPAAATLMAQRFDPNRRVLADRPFPIAASVTAGLDPGSASLSVSSTGVMAYRADVGSARRQFAWFDRAGKLIATVGEPDHASPVNPSLSADGRYVAIRRSISDNADIWLLDSKTGLLGRLTARPGLHNFPVWSPDDRYVAFTANLNRGSVNNFYRQAADGGGDEELLFETPQNKGLADWSADGRFMLFRSVDPKTGNDIWAVSLTDRNPFVVAQTNFDERDGQFSPDGRWIAYQSNETGDFEIWVRPFPGPGDRVRISTNGGTQVRWRRDGKELFYIAMDGRLMSVPLSFDAQGPSLEPGIPVGLFSTRIGGALQGFNRHQYAVAPDGQRFLMNTLLDEGTLTITLIQNWKERPN
jgi:Tol biopolymer transport system component